MKLSDLLKPLALVSMAWSIFIVVGVVLNSSFSLTRAAGGQFTQFPLGIRMTYLGTTVLLLLQAWTLIQIWGAKAVRPQWLPRFFLIMSGLSAVVNSLSKSHDERWNAIPALITAWAFWVFAPNKEGDSPDPRSR
ncbi:MAG: hypothetical protein WCK72_06770 [Actinomycetes bacterium]